ncbi:dTDP-4-dehydrorhamnose reductase [Candidatus Protochlamydia phocaeensis]|uniref:dTDP-4-dehydrorhamnose reductase n=1 Tax=Candidatus Protochlamydia phocaeensis TaxID=1414722 RepID=UPI00083920B3|nr:dTDP-4-dehydrorhamnose reductase [Candidatus Protochlamydia phocaeensis]
MKKIWICGAAGMLGSHFTRLLTKRAIPFVANDHQQIDITQLEMVSDFVRTQKISHIINCAAYTQVDKAEVEQKQAYLINAVGPHYLGIAGRRHGARVVHFSTDYVFDGKGRAPYTEEHTCTPMGAYGMSKLAGEVKLLDEHEHSCIIRTSWLFGLPGKNFVDTMLRLMQERDQLRIVSDQIGRPTYCQDLAEATLDLLDEEGIFHFANAFETSWYQFAKEIYRQGKELNFPLKSCAIEPIQTEDYPTPAKRPAYSTLSTKKIERHLGRMPRPWQEALYDYLTTFKRYQETQQLI